MVDGRFRPLARDSVREVQVLAYPRNASPRAILQGQAGAGVDLTAYVSRVQQTESSLSFTLAWHRELQGAAMVQPGQWVLVRLGAAPLCVQQVESLSDFRVMHGVQQVTVQARTRDATGRWRDQTITTPTYALAAPLITIVVDVCKAMGLSEDEVRVTQLSAHAPRASMQLSGVSAWAALEAVLLPAGFTPYVDALGRLSAFSRDVKRDADLVLDAERVEALAASRSRPPLTRLQLRWRAPQMATVLQGERMLASTRVMGGFFRMRQVKRLKFSQDGTQRATAVRMEIKDSINRLLPVAREYMLETSHDSAAQSEAAVVVEMRKYLPAFLGMYVVGKIAMATMSDYHNYVTTISFGRVLEAGFDVAMLVTFMSIGEGLYELHGRPLDAVEVVNTTEAFDPTASPASQKREVIETDFVANEGAATAYVLREFVYRARAATSWTLTIVDDPRLEPGDIVQLPSGERVLITGYQRDLTPGAPALLELTGFPA